MAINFLNLKKKTDIQVQEAHRVPNKMNPNRLKLRHFQNQSWRHNPPRLQVTL